MISRSDLSPYVLCEFIVGLKRSWLSFPKIGVAAFLALALFIMFQHSDIPAIAHVLGAEVGNGVAQDSPELRIYLEPRNLLHSLTRLLTDVFCKGMSF